MKCLLLGGNGFLGRHIGSTLLDHGHEVVVFDRPTDEYFVGDPRIEYFYGDFLNIGDVNFAVEGCDIIFHLVSTTLPNNSNADMLYDIDSNVMGTVKMLSSALKNNIKKVIFASSGGTIYGVPNEIPTKEHHSINPICSYGICKLAIEKYLNLFYSIYGLDYTVLRVANAYGEGQRTEAKQGAVGVFIGKALKHKSIEVWGDGNVIRDYIYVKDVAKAFYAAMLHNGNEKVFNIGCGVGKSLNDILDVIELELGIEVNRKYLPNRIIDVPVSILDCTLAINELSWAPTTSFSEGISKTIKFYLENLDY